MTEREKFEKWANGNARILQMRGAETDQWYGAWLGWQAALSAAPTPPDSTGNALIKELILISDRLSGWAKDAHITDGLSQTPKIMEKAGRTVYKAAQALAPTLPDSGCGVTEEWELSPTPPEVEPVYFTRKPGDAYWAEIAKVDAEGYYTREDWPIRILYTSPPSPKASWDAEGNPTNLEAAARDAEELLQFWAKDYGRLINDDEKVIIENLRKFLEEKS